MNLMALKAYIVEVILLLESIFSSLAASSIFIFIRYLSNIVRSKKRIPINPANPDTYITMAEDIIWFNVWSMAKPSFEGYMMSIEQSVCIILESLVIEMFLFERGEHLRVFITIVFATSLYILRPT